MRGYTLRKSAQRLIEIASPGEYQVVGSKLIRLDTPRAAAAASAAAALGGVLEGSSAPPPHASWVTR